MMSTGRAGLCELRNSFQHNFGDYSTTVYNVFASPFETTVISVFLQSGNNESPDLEAKEYQKRFLRPIQANRTRPSF